MINEVNKKNTNYGDLGPTPSPVSYNTAFFQTLARIKDMGNQLIASFGLRTYRVFKIKLQWTGSEWGSGILSIREALEVLPTPKVEDLSAIGRYLFSGGIHEEGKVRVSQISAIRWNEDNLLGLDPQSGNTNDRERSIWMITEAIDSGITDTISFVSDTLGIYTGANGMPTAVSASDVASYNPSNVNPVDGAAFTNLQQNRKPQNRVFVQFGAAYLNPKTMCWEITLERVHPDIFRDGTINQIGVGNV